MAGRRLLDAAILGNAARTVASQHLKLRSQQLDTWNKTSTIAKAVKHQTDRITLTVQAASALAQRFNEPDHSTSFTNTQDESIRRHETAEHKTADGPTQESLNQDLHYQRPEQNEAPKPTKNGGLRVAQEQAAPYPIRDGSIPPDSVPNQSASPIRIDSDIVSDRQQEPPAKDPVARERQTDFEPKASSRSSIPIPTVEAATEIPSKVAVPVQEGVPEGINTDVFHSPRIAEMLAGKSQIGKPKDGLRARQAKETSLNGRQTDEKDQDISNVRMSTQLPVTNADQTVKYTPPAESARPSEDDVHTLIADIESDTEKASAVGGSNNPQETADLEPGASAYQMRESRVPSSRFGRLAQYGGLATSMVFGAVGETFRRATGSGSSGGSLMLSAGNMERLVAKLSRMRGAALKLGQMMSFQDSKMLPAPIHEVLSRVQDNADYMPTSQRDRVLSSNLGSDWRSLFSSFGDVPIAAASIGQVHRATLASSNTPVAVKIQYPGVATSISSDLSNLSILLTASRLLPKGLYLDKTIANAREELAWECDYKREADCQERFRELLADEQDIFTVPAVFREACGPQVLTAELMHGTGVTKPSLHLSQAERDWIGTHILRLCLRELTEFRVMQTDPNWTNFLYNRAADTGDTSATGKATGTGKIELLDFGATREFPSRFVDPYVRILLAAASDDRDSVRDLSVQLGYLTGAESSAMVDAHVTSVLVLAEPFRAPATAHATPSAGDGDDDDGVLYDFRDQTVTDRVRAQIPIMLRERLAPPPEETYSLHRRLSGIFLLLAKLGSRVKTRELFTNAIAKWEAAQAGSP